MSASGIDSARVRYELLLQPAYPGAPFPAEQVDAKLAEAGVTAGPEGLRRWPFKHGQVEVRPLLEGGQQIATELLVPLSDRTDLVRELVVAASALAKDSDVVLLDLQLNRAVTEKDAETVGSRYLEAARYAGEMLGVAEAIPASFAAPTEQGMKAGTKVLLALGAAFFLLLWLLDLIA